MSEFINRRIFLVCACWILMSAGAFAQTAPTISGTVTDTNGAAIAGAIVTALNIASTQRTTAITDAAGKYTLNDLRSGETYRITASASGFAEAAESVTLKDGVAETKDFSLAPGAIRDVVTVTAGKGSERVAVETPQTVTVVTSEQIEKEAPRSTFETMERAPNIESVETSPARERPRLRGLASNRLLIVVDGEKLNNARTDPGASGAPVAIVDPSQLESVEVLGGSGSSLYGSDAIAGTINLVTKSPERPDNGFIMSLRLGGNYYSNGQVRRGDATINLSTPKIAFRASGFLYRHDNYHMGDGAITLADNLKFGNFFIQFPTNAAGTTFQSASSYPIFSLAPHAVITNGTGHGNAEQGDIWYYPTEKHNFRLRYINRDEGLNGNAFSGPPFEVQERFSNFRSYRKFSARYEGVDLLKYMPRVAVNFFYQRYSFPQDLWNYNLVAGSSYINATTFTGNPSTFTPSSFTDNLNTIKTTGIDVQATLLPIKNLLLTVGGGRTKDHSKDDFLSSPFTFVGTARVLTGTRTVGSSTPVSDYVDNNFYAQGEYDRLRWLRITAGLRFDNWVTTGYPGNGFPLSTEFTALNAAIPGLTANPSALTSLVASLPSLVSLAGGNSTAGTNRNSVTGNVGFVFRLPYGINPYFRFANSYREPAITERYLIRNFSPGIYFASLVVGNPGLLPERGKNYDVGVKVQRKIFSFSFGYFHNELTDLIDYAPAQNYCVAPVPPGLPGSNSAVFFGCAAGQAVVSINARINKAAAVIYGLESIGEVAIPLGRYGSINPYYSFGTLHGTNKSPVQQQITALNLLYNKSTTPIPLTGSVDDFPLNNITPFRIVGGAQYLDNKGRFFAEYTFRHQNRVTRADPLYFIGTTLINYGTFASLNAFTKQDIKAGYNWRRERYRATISAGIDNLTDRLFFEQFNTAPAPGRAYVFGFSVEFFNLLKHK